MCYRKNEILYVKNTKESKIISLFGMSILESLSDFKLQSCIEDLTWGAPDILVSRKTVFMWSVFPWFAIFWAELRQWGFSQWVQFVLAPLPPAKCLQEKSVSHQICSRLLLRGGGGWCCNVVRVLSVTFDFCYSISLLNIRLLGINFENIVLNVSKYNCMKFNSEQTQIQPFHPPLTMTF